MALAGAILAQWLFLLIPHPLVLLATMAMTLYCLWRDRGELNWSAALIFAGLLAFPLWFGTSLLQRQSSPDLPEVAGLEALVDLESYRDTAAFSEAMDVLNSDNPRLGNPSAVPVLESLDLPQHTALTVLNLNLEPVVWRGSYFSNDYRDIQPNRMQLVVRDGRLFLVNLVPVPTARETSGFLVMEVLLTSKHRDERSRSWMAAAEVSLARYMPVVVGPSDSDFLLRLSDALIMTPPPFEIAFVPQDRVTLGMDLAAMVWIFFLTAALFRLSRTPHDPWLGRFRPALLVLLAFSGGTQLDWLTTFGSYIWADDTALGLMINPGKTLLAFTLIFLILRDGLPHLVQRHPRLNLGITLILLVALTLMPHYFQAHYAFSLAHPLEGFSSPGAFLAQIGFLSSICYLVLLLQRTLPQSLGTKLWISGPLLATVAFWEPMYLAGLASLALLWVLKDLRARPVTVAALSVLTFYPSLVIGEQRDEVRRVRDEILDEITLMVERNYFRMGRVIQRLPNLRDQIEAGPHEHLTEMFAKQSGLFEDDIDFALRITDPNGNTVSEIAQHVSPDRFPELGPLDVIEPHPLEDPSWLLYRRNVPTRFGDYGFLAVLGNDYRNLSLIRRLRDLGEDGFIRRNDRESPYLAYLMDVFDASGNALYTQSTPKPLSERQWAVLADEPYGWFVRGRETIFLFRERNTIYRITHKATPLKMIAVRYLAHFLITLILFNLFHLALRPGRGMVHRWRRSFAMKLAGFMFLSSVVPTSMLGYLLINSIQRNQVREAETIAKSKVEALINLYREYVRPPDEASPVRGGLINRRELPLRQFSEVLGEDLSFYLTGTLENTNQPEIFRMGILSRRLDFEMVRELFLEKKSYALDWKPLNRGGELLVAYTPILMPPNRSGVLAMTMIPFSQSQKIRWQEQLEFSLTLLFGLLYLMAELTRFFARSVLRPVGAITKSATRVAANRSHEPIRIGRQDELDRMVQAFNTMLARVQKSQAALRQELNLLDETLKSMSSGLLGFDHGGRVVLKNNKVMLLFGWQQPPVDLSALIERVPALAPLAVLFDSGAPDTFAFPFTKNDEQREILATFRLVEDRDVRDVRGILVLEDITDAMAANRFKAWSEMASRVAHEIKNPLTPIQLEVDHLTQLYRDKHPRFSDALEEAAREIRGQVQHLRRIATEFSDYARPLQIEPEETDLAALLRDIVDPYCKTLPSVDIVLALDTVPMRRLDNRLLRRAIHNLVVNAIQAMDKVGRLRLVLRAESGFDVIMIEDTGPGIPDEEQERVFEAYFSTKDQGSGLGLVIARKYIRVHGGTLTIDRSYTHGTRFVIRIPNPLPDEVLP